MQSALVELSYGNFKLQIYVIVTCFDEGLFSQGHVAKGSFGSIYQLSFDSKKYAIKGINIIVGEGIAKLDEIYRQYFLSYMASFLQVGPKIHQIMGYDIVVFNKKACFAMQSCSFVQDKASDLKRLQDDLAHCIRTIHSIGLVHLDIKPSNVMFSQALRKYVLIDFGLSKLINEQVGMKTKTMFYGTLGYCSEQMRKLVYSIKPKLIDLYSNDLICFNKSIQKFYRYALHPKMKIYSLTQSSDQQSNTEYFLESAIVIVRLKYFVYTAQISQIVYHAKANQDYVDCFYLILTDYLTKKQGEKPLEITQLVSQLKKLIMSQSKQKSKSIYDKYIIYILGSRQRPQLIPHLLCINYLLEIEAEKFRVILTNQDFTMRLFFIFDPSSPIFPFQNSVGLRQVNSLRKKIADKIYESLKGNSSSSCQLLRLRVVIQYFYEKLKKSKSRSLMVSIMVLFLFIDDYSHLFQVQKLIIQQASDLQLKILTILQFSLFLDGTFYYFAEEKECQLKSILNKIDVGQNQGLGLLKKDVDTIMGRKKSFVDQFKDKDWVKEILNNIEDREMGNKNATQILKDIKLIYSSIIKEQLTYPIQNFKQCIYFKYFEFGKKQKSDIQIIFHEFLTEQLFLYQVKSIQNFLEMQFELSRIRGNAFFNLYALKLVFNDENLLKRFIQLYDQHLNSFCEFAQEQVYFGYLGFLSLLKQYRKSKLDKNNKKILLSLQQAFISFNKKIKKQHRQKNDFGIIYLSIFGVLQIYKNKNQANFIGILEQLKKKSLPLPYPSNVVMSFIIEYILTLTATKTGEGQRTKDIFLIEIIDSYVQNGMHSFLLMNPSASYLYIIANTKIGNQSKNFSLLKNIINFISSSKSYNQQSYRQLLKFTIMAITLVSNEAEILDLFTKFHKEKISSIKGEEMYCEIYLYIDYYMKRYCLREVKDSIFNQENVQKELKRAHLGLKLMKRQLFNEAKLWLLKLFRKTLKHKYERKERICLKLQGKYKIYSTKSLKRIGKLKQIFRLHLEKKLKILKMFDFQLENKWNLSIEI